MNSAPTKRQLIPELSLTCEVRRSQWSAYSCDWITNKIRMNIGASLKGHLDFAKQVILDLQFCLRKIADYDCVEQACNVCSLNRIPARSE